MEAQLMYVTSWDAYKDYNLFPENYPNVINFYEKRRIIKKIRFKNTIKETAKRIKARKEKENE